MIYYYSFHTYYHHGLNYPRILHTQLHLLRLTFFILFFLPSIFILLEVIHLKVNQLFVWLSIELYISHIFTRFSTIDSVMIRWIIRKWSELVYIVFEGRYCTRGPIFKKEFY
jgi:hypothetical protein